MTRVAQVTDAQVGLLALGLTFYHSLHDWLVLDAKLGWARRADMGRRSRCHTRMLEGGGRQLLGIHECVHGIHGAARVVPPMVRDFLDWQLDLLWLWLHLLLLVGRYACHCRSEPVGRG